MAVSIRFTLRGDCRTPKLWGKEREEQRKSHSEQHGPLVQQLPDRDAGKVSVACAQHREHVGLNSGCTGGFEEWAVIAGDSEADAGGGGVGKIASAPHCVA